MSAMVDDEVVEEPPAPMADSNADEKEQAERLHGIAVRAEAKAAARAAAKDRGVVLEKEEAASTITAAAKPVFQTKAMRAAEALKRLEVQREARAAEMDDAARQRRTQSARGRFSAPPVREAKVVAADYARMPRNLGGEAAATSSAAIATFAAAAGVKRGRDGAVAATAVAAAQASTAAPGSAASDKELSVIRESYLGKAQAKKRVVKPSEKFSRIFQFDWDAQDDTSADLNPLYSRRHAVQPLLGRGYVAGLDMREQRRAHTFAEVLSEKRMGEERAAEEAEGLAKKERKEREARRKEEREELQAKMALQTQGVEARALGKRLLHWTDKSLEDMDERDWRIMKEDFDIRVRGGRAPMPLRSWAEAGLAAEILQAIEVMGFKEPSPIQRAAIPVGLELRDIIGVAETGSGKTCAFAIPMLQYISKLPKERIASLAEDGPLALVLAPTRELATQICAEVARCAQFMDIKTCVVVGGSSIEDQAFKLRQGVEIIVGTPGRINDCLESQYLVLNQANYVVLDEADRMIDMGFEPQVNEILETMGGLLKSEDEVEIAEQEAAVKRGEACFRITAMFSATMPAAVERLAKKFLRLPAIVAIGDEDSGKNKRIEQRIAYMKDAEKKNQLAELLRRKGPEDKYIVFCNEKKTCDVVGKVAQAVIRCGIIHGGKQQDVRDSTLQMYKDGVITVLVATDVAGRGLDIPDVAMVINFDMPLKIENYCHRIGRTGRAGKTGIATTFLTDSDEAMMYELREYLVQTNADVPMKLEKNPAAHAKPGERNDRGELLSARASKGRDKTEYLKEDKFDK